jgi:hypothetical protein
MISPELFHEVVIDGFFHRALCLENTIYVKSYAAMSETVSKKVTNDTKNKILLFLLNDNIIRDTEKFSKIVDELALEIMNE